jgi:hypothetical protein
VLDGRVKRRLRRNGLSEEINIIEWDKRNEAKERRSEVKRLKEELAAKDLEVQSMRDEQDIASQIEGGSGVALSTNSSLSAKVQGLEREIRNLKAELLRKESDSPPMDPNWTLAAKDPFDFGDDDGHMITNYDDDFRESMVNDEMITTPTRLNTSFPSPPSTMPNTPCKSVSSISAGIQASLPVPDPENEILKSQLQSLQSEVSKLTAAITFKEDHQSRLGEKLSEFIPTNQSHDHTTLDSALDTVLTQLAISQAHALERNNAFSALTTEISSLGFPSSGPEEVLETIAKQFRQARLDLEYLTPGEVVEGFENDKLLEMLVSRIKVLLEKVKERDDTIDEYHEQEILLRQQLSSRVDAMDGLKKELYLASTVVRDLREEIQDKETSNERLQAALEGYRDEVSGLEKLIERMERDGRDNEQQLRSEVQEAEERLQDEVLKHDTTRADSEGKEMMMVELERRLSAALQAIAELEQQLTTLSSSNETALAEKDATVNQLKASSLQREMEHGNALALRDARVSELRDEISRVNDAIKTAHSTIVSLRKENIELEAQVHGEKTRREFVVKSMREQLNRLETGLNGDVSVRGPARGQGRSKSVGAEVAPEATAQTQGGVRRGRFLDGDLARRGSKKRRRYDSGLGFLEEGDETMELSIETS